MPDNNFISEGQNENNFAALIRLSELHCDIKNEKDDVTGRFGSELLESFDVSENPCNYCEETTGLDFETNQAGKLPPLASVFPQSKNTTSFENPMNDRCNILIPELKLCDFKLISKAGTNKFPDCFERNHQSQSIQNYANYFQQAFKLPNFVYQNFCVESAGTISALQSNKSFSRKRLQSGIYRDSSIPPSVNAAFKKLRNLIPTEPADRRLSKVETLRLAVSYIQHLGQTLNSDHWVEQPCLVKTTSEAGKHHPIPICTFCMSKKRKITINSR